MIRAMLLLHKLLLCLSLKSDLFPFLLQLHQWLKGDPVEHHIDSAAILHYKQTDRFILHDVMTIENEPKVGNSKLQPASVLYVDLGELG